jgi:hypothetical protein
MTPKQIDDELKARWWDRLRRNTAELKSTDPEVAALLEHHMTVALLAEEAATADRMAGRILTDAELEKHLEAVLKVNLSATRPG